MTIIGNWPGRKKKINAECAESAEFAEKSREGKSRSLTRKGRGFGMTAQEERTGRTQAEACAACLQKFFSVAKTRTGSIIRAILSGLHPQGHAAERGLLWPRIPFPSPN